MRYDTILFDADDTLFDFQKSAEQCFLKTSADFSLPTEKNNYDIYKEINQSFWDKYSRGEITKTDVIILRFIEYGKTIGKTFDPKKFAESYEKSLSRSAILIDGSFDVLITLVEMGIQIYLITNGVSFIQRSRLKDSGIEKFFDGIFISDELGYAKPSNQYCDIVFNSIAQKDKSKIIICGDSPVADIQMGNVLEVDTCLYDKINKYGNEIKCTYKIDDLKKILDIVR